MPSRYWGFIFAVGLGLLDLDSAGARPPEQQSNTQDTGQETKAPPVVTAWTKPPERPDYHLDSCYQSSSQENADLCAQWRAAFAAEEAANLAWWGNIIGGVGAALSFIGTILVIVALRHARDANKIARDIGAAQTRAYIEFGKAEMAFSDHGFPSGVVVLLKNVGHTPARNVESWVSARSFPPDASMFQIVHTPEHLVKSKATIGPELNLTMSLPFDWDDDTLRVTDVEQGGRLFVYGEVTYIDVFQEHHVTKFRLFAAGGSGQFISHSEGNEST